MEYYSKLGQLPVVAVHLNQQVQTSRDDIY